MPLAEDQRVIQALAAKRSREPFRVGVRLRRPDWRLDDPRAAPREYLIEAVVNLPSQSRIRNLNPPARSPRSIIRLRACWAVQAPAGCAVTPRMCTALFFPGGRAFRCRVPLSARGSSGSRAVASCESSCGSSSWRSSGTRPYLAGISRKWQPSGREKTVTAVDTLPPTPLPLGATHRLVTVRTAFLLLALMVLGLVIGCSNAPSSAPDKIVVVASASANEPGPVLAAGDRALLSAAGTGSSATVYVVNTNTGQPTSVSLTPRRPDGQVEYGPRRSTLLAQNVDRVQRLLAQEAATVPFDLLALIAAGVRVTSAPATLLILSSGLSTSGGFDLRQVGWDARPAVAVAKLKQAGLLPSLTGWKVVFSGLGDTVGRQPTLPLPQQTTLSDYWMAICRSADAASCTTDSTTRPDPPSRSHTLVPVVPVPTVVSVTGPHNGNGISVPTEEFFAFASAQLLPSANTILSPIAARARAGHQLISITGYASPDGGTAAYNDALSLARARAVAARLHTLGLRSSQIARITGAGTAGTTQQNCDSNGQLDEARCAALRRVVILLTPQPASAS